MARRAQLLAATLLFAAAVRPARGGAWTRYADPLLATRGGGGFGGWGCQARNPGAMYPHALLRLGPDTSRVDPVLGEVWSKLARHAGYFGSDSHVRAFSHTHVQGAGDADLGTVGVMVARADAAGSFVKQMRISSHPGPVVHQMARHFVIAALVVLRPMSAAISSHSHAQLATVDVSHVAALSLTGSPINVRGVCATNESPCADASVSLAGGASFPAPHLTYTAGVTGWSGVIPTYVPLDGPAARGALPGTPPPRTPPLSRSTLLRLFPGRACRRALIVKADMGTVIPLGFAVAEQIEKDNAAQPFDLAVLASDLAYATVSPPNDEFEEVWDSWGH